MTETRSLEFFVIGAQKSGTTTLWELLRDHPHLWLPATKEAPFFSHTRVFERGLDAYLTQIEAPPSGRVRRGTVTPHYMLGWRDASTATVASRMAGALPGAKLIALLREPISRARSQHAMNVARERERRDAVQALSDHLEPDALQQARLEPHETNTYVVQGEYGRILGEYLSCFPRDQLHVQLTSDLEADPAATLRRVLRFLGVSDDFRPPDLGRRAFAAGGPQRLAEDDLTALIDEVASGPPADWPAALTARLRERGVEDAATAVLAREAARGDSRGLVFYATKIWNFQPRPPVPLPPSLEERLRAHYAQDAERLAAVGVSVPWSTGQPA